MYQFSFLISLCAVGGGGSRNASRETLGEEILVEPTAPLTSRFVCLRVLRARSHGLRVLRSRVTPRSHFAVLAPFAASPLTTSRFSLRSEPRTVRGVASATPPGGARRVRRTAGAPHGTPPLPVGRSDGWRAGGRSELQKSGRPYEAGTVRRPFFGEENGALPPIVVAGYSTPRWSPSCV